MRAIDKDDKTLYNARMTTLPQATAPDHRATLHVLMVDDDPLMRRSLEFTLTQAGYQVTACANAETALASFATVQPDVILLDIGLPGMDGLEALRQMQRMCAAPVIFVTARRRELEQVLGLELGADDYITKPFDPDVLLARMRAVLRRSRRSETAATTNAKIARPEIVRAGDLVIDLGAHTVHVADRSLDLSPREFDLLLVFARQPQRVLGVEELLRLVWGPQYEGEPQIVYVHVRRLREKLEESPNSPTRLITVRGVGYKLLLQEP